MLAGNFGDGMVLQRGPASSAVYGTATPAAFVTVTLAEAKSSYTWSSTPARVSARADGANNASIGTWKVLLPARPAGHGYTLTATCRACTNASATAIASEVMFGEV